MRQYIVRVIATITLDMIAIYVVWAGAEWLLGKPEIYPEPGRNFISVVLILATVMLWWLSFWFCFGGQRPATDVADR